MGEVLKRHPKLSKSRATKDAPRLLVQRMSHASPRGAVLPCKLPVLKEDKVLSRLVTPAKSEVAPKLLTRCGWHLQPWIQKVRAALESTLLGSEHAVVGLLSSVLARCCTIWIC